jgi:hypothetical protein
MLRPYAEYELPLDVTDMFPFIEVKVMPLPEKPYASPLVLTTSID